ncbi:beta-galactosidase [Shouchella clausii]|uniref:beta-galactosidase n=1 Tax=Shouchella clausii TaxID=79880 RepID=UPI00280B5C3F|nr:beta-galactosidase [Shouchella clausii]WMM34175.1 beta-galactosidase [Shouchella clausii]
MKYPPVHPTVEGMMHGGDYNPDQWLHMPEIIEEDFRLMPLAHCNTFSINIFGWSAIEPEEGVYTFAWLDDIMDCLAEKGYHAILATPSGARPAWLSKAYPEVLRVEADRRRNLHGQRHNHCLTSPVYRQKVKQINRKLAERYKGHPALKMWHISNEYGGACHCDYCQDAFRTWLKHRYDNRLAKLNEAWWTGFWSHTYTDWEQIESPAPHGESMIHGHNLDWKRFVTDQTIDFYRNEIEPLRELTPEIKITTNFMGNYPHMRPFLGLNYRKFADELDVISWDSYPGWHGERQSTEALASDVAFVHDIYRSLKGGQPFLLMESTPSLVNWHDVNRAKKPGMHELSSLQAVAHGADAILYFQWRKSRGSSEKFHGAVVDHVGHEHTRVFQEVAQLGRTLEQLAPVAGSTVEADVAIIYDWENQWAIDDAQATNNIDKGYASQVQSHYRSFWKHGVPVDVVSMNDDISTYKIVVAPMLYMLKPGVAEQIEAYVKNGGTFIATYWSGIVDETDLCFLGGFPGPLKPVLGVWAEEIDSLYKHETVPFTWNGDTYEAHSFIERIHLKGAETIAAFQGGSSPTPAVTKNRLGKGTAYYMASANEQRFYDAFYELLINEHGLAPPIAASIPTGVSVQTRTNGEYAYTFFMNFSEDEKRLTLNGEKKTIHGETINQVTLRPYGWEVVVEAI